MGLTKANPVCPEDFGPYILSGVLIRLQPLLPAVCMSERCPSENWLLCKPGSGEVRGSFSSSDVSIISFFLDSWTEVS